MRKYKIAIIGSGSLGGIIAENILKELSKNYELLGVHSRRIENAKKLANRINCKAYHTLDDMLEDKPDYIVEAATPDVLKKIGLTILEKGINLVVLSAGAFADKEFYNNAEQTALENNCRIHIASGAVGGFDVLYSTMLMEDVQTSIITEKPPSSLNGAPFLKDRKLSEDTVEEIFNGSAEEAIKLFPQNINVAIATALAVNDVDNIKVVIRSNPQMESNRHRIELRGPTVQINIDIDSKPSPQNPKSSTLAAWSVIALLRNLVSPIAF